MIDVCLLARRKRAAEGLDVAVLDELIQRRQRRVVEHRLLDFELIGIFDPLLELFELAVALAGDPVRLGL